MLRSTQLRNTGQTRLVLIYDGTHNLSVEYGTFPYFKGCVATLVSTKNIFYQLAFISGNFLYFDIFANVDQLLVWEIYGHFVSSSLHSILHYFPTLDGIVWGISLLIVKFVFPIISNELLTQLNWLKYKRSVFNVLTFPTRLRQCLFFFFISAAVHYTQCDRYYCFLYLHFIAIKKQLS